MKIIFGFMLPLACVAASVTPWTNPLVKPTGAWKAWCDGGAYAVTAVYDVFGNAVEGEPLTVTVEHLSVGTLLLVR